MSAFAYYNEIEPFAVEWLRALIREGVIADGEVDNRSIVDVDPADLIGFAQCHFFAGIGVWSYALRRAGWPDDRAVWTGSCPCQSFSTSGKRKGFSDDRHLWPFWYGLIYERRPPVVFGEQVASKDAEPWLDLVQTDLESADYAVGSADLCVAGVGGPHIRQRFYFVGADPTRKVEHAEEATRRLSVRERGSHEDQFESCGSSETRFVGVSVREPSQWGAGTVPRTQAARDCEGLQHGRVGDGSPDAGETRGLAHRYHERLEGRFRAELSARPDQRAVGTRGASGELADTNGGQSSDGQRSGRLVQLSPNPLAGFWSDANWIYCRDDKYRPVEPGTFPLAHGAPARVGRLRGYGNAICAEVATTFIEAYLDIEAGRVK